MRKPKRELGKAALMSLQRCELESGVPYTTWRDLVLSGHLPRVQLGDSRRHWVRRSDFERVINTTSTTEAA